MSGILVPEISTQYGGLDDAAFASGAASSSAILRALGMGANRLVCQPEPVLNWIWDASEDGVNGTLGQLRGYLVPLWGAATPPVLVPKRPGVTRIDLKLIAKIDNGRTGYLQVVTDATPYHEAATVNDHNVITLAGTGAFQSYTLFGLPVSAAPFEHVQLFVKGEPTTDAGDVATYGGPNTGSVTTAAPNFIINSGATWNIDSASDNTWAKGGHVLVFKDNASGNVIAPPQWIVEVPAADELYMYPGFVGSTFTQVQASSSHDVRFHIYKLPSWRFAALAGYSALRTL